MLGVNVGVAAPVAWFPFSGWKDSLDGDLHANGRDAVEFYTRKKVVTSRWSLSPPAGPEVAVANSIRCRRGCRSLGQPGDEPGQQAGRALPPLLEVLAPHQRPADHASRRGSAAAPAGRGQAAHRRSPGATARRGGPAPARRGSAPRDARARPRCPCSRRRSGRDRRPGSRSSGRWVGETSIGPPQACSIRLPGEGGKEAHQTALHLGDDARVDLGSAVQPVGARTTRPPPQPNAMRSIPRGPEVVDQRPGVGDALAARSSRAHRGRRAPAR